MKQSHLVKTGASMQAIADDYPGEVMDYGDCDPHMDMFVAVKELDAFARKWGSYRGGAFPLVAERRADVRRQQPFWAITAKVGLPQSRGPRRDVNAGIDLHSSYQCIGVQLYAGR